MGNSCTSGPQQYIEVQSVPGSIRCKGIYVIKSGDVTKICCTFYFNIAVPVRDRKFSVGDERLRRASTCHQAEVHDAAQQGDTEEFVFMDSYEAKPKLKPIKGKHTSNIIGFVMTFPGLHPKFFAKFKKELGKKKSRKSVYSQQPREEVRKSLKVARGSSFSKQRRWN